MILKISVNSSDILHSDINCNNLKTQFSDRAFDFYDDQVANLRENKCKEER